MVAAAGIRAGRRRRPERPLAPIDTPNFLTAET
jgi:hypothetical protein